MILCSDGSLIKIQILGIYVWLIVTNWLIKPNKRYWSCKSKIEFSLSAMKPIFISALIIIIFSFLILILQRKHILISLLALESIMLTLVYSIILLSCIQFNTHLLPLILTFGASEARIGLALLVVLTRSYGSDTVNIISLRKC